MSIFEISESPTLENVSSIIKKGLKIKSKEEPKVLGKTNVLKIMVNKQAFYHFSKGEFDSELATRKQDVIVGGKRFYMGLKNNSSHTKMKLNSQNND